MVQSFRKVLRLFLIIFILSLMIFPVLSLNSDFSTNIADSTNFTYGIEKSSHNTGIPIQETGIHHTHLKLHNFTKLKTYEERKIPYNSNPDNASSVSPGGHLYKITFNEHGLPGNMLWYVAILHERFRQNGFRFLSNGLPYSGDLMNLNIFETTNSSTTNYISVFLSNGKYEYFAGPQGTYYEYKTFTVNDQSANITLSFPKFYRVTFNVENLPRGIAWNVLGVYIKGSQYYYNESKSSNMIAYLVNGTYDLMVGPKSTLINETSLHVDGKDIIRTVKLPPLYSVTFKEVNLHSGIRWDLFTDNANCSFSYQNSSYNRFMTAYLPDATGYDFR